MSLVEKEVLYKMKISSTIFLNTIKQIKKYKQQIDKAIKLDMDNNYFIEKKTSYTQFNNVFDIQSIDVMINIIEPLINNILEELEQMCQAHEYIDDHIETGISCIMKKIYYCKVCHVSKKSE